MISSEKNEGEQHEVVDRSVRFSLRNVDDRDR